MINQRDILLVPFPFSDQSGRKVRPVLVLSGDVYNKKCGDVIVCAITSNLRTDDYSIIIDAKKLESGKLYEKSSIKVDSLLKIDKDLVIKNVGTLNKDTFQEVISVLMKIFNI